MDNEKLKNLREAVGWSVAHAAKQFSRSTSTWYAMEAGRLAVPQAIITFLEFKASNTSPSGPKPTPAHLRVFRKHFELTQALAASLAGVSRVSWNRWEMGKAPIPDHMLHTLRGLVVILKNKEEE